DGGDRADAVILIRLLRRARQLRRGRPVAVGARRHAAAGADQFLRVLPADLEILARLRGVLPLLGGRFLALRRAGFLFGLRPLLLDFFLRLQVPLPRRTGDGARQHRAVQAAIADERDEIVGHLAAVEQLGVLDSVDARRDRDAEPFDRRRVRLGRAVALV